MRIRPRSIGTVEDLVVGGTRLKLSDVVDVVTVIAQAPDDRGVDALVSEQSVSRDGLGKRIGDVSAKDLGAKAHSGKHVVAGQTRVGLEDLLHRLAGTKLDEDGLDRHAGAFDDWLAHHDVRVRHDTR
jgi:hypothetical protein